MNQEGKENRYKEKMKTEFQNKNKTRKVSDIIKY